MDRAKAMSLEEAVKLSLSNPEVRAAQANRRAVDQDFEEARGLYFPTVDLRGDMGLAEVDNTSTRAIGSNDDWLWRRQASLIVVQKLFDGGNVANQVDRQRARVKAAAARVAERSEFTGLDAVQAYLDVLRQTELVRFAEQNLQATVSKMQDVRSRVRAGRSGIADQRQAENRVAQARNDVVTVQRSLDESRALFLRVVGADANGLSRPGLPKVIPANVEGALRDARRNNPSILTASREVEAADAQVRVNDASWYPQVNLELSGTTGDNIGGLRGSNREYLALLVARWNLYSGGSDTARRSGSLQRAIQTREELRSTIDRTGEEVRRSWIAMSRQRERAGILRERVKSAEGVLAAYSQQFNVGQRDLLDVLDAQNDLFNVRSELLTAEFSEIFASYRLVAVTGGLMASLNIARPSEAKCH
jgi:adhesin transport system outer membrane protein